MVEFDPLDYKNLTRHVVEELMRRDVTLLSNLNEFQGSGVYAIFYDGDLPFYEEIRSPDATRPIYVGKAVPSGARKGQIQTSPTSKTLHKRLTEHQKSILSVDNLAPESFKVRYLVVKPLWIVMAEGFLIQHYQPIWNCCIDGFGLHDPGKNRPGKLSAWDTIHPGRSRSWKSTPKIISTQEEVIASLRTFLLKKR